VISKNSLKITVGKFLQLEKDLGLLTTESIQDWQ